MNKIKLTLAALMIAIGLASVLTPVYVGASPSSEIMTGVNSTTDTPPAGKDLNSTIKTVVNVMLFILGALAVIMIVVGGIRYTTSAGNASSIKGAKDTMTYAIVGLIVALFAYAIVNFVVTKLG